MAEMVNDDPRRKEHLAAVQMALDKDFEPHEEPQLDPYAESQLRPLRRSQQPTRSKRKSSTLDAVLALSLFGQFGVLSRRFLTLPFSPLFVTLPANLVGCFLLGCLCDGKAASALLMHAAAANPEAVASQARSLRGVSVPLFGRFFDGSPMLLLGMRTGLCGCLTTFSSWNQSMVRLFITGEPGSALAGYLLGLLLALAALQLGQRTALSAWLARQRLSATGVVPLSTKRPQHAAETAAAAAAASNRRGVLRAAAVFLLISVTLLELASLGLQAKEHSLLLSLLFCPAGVLSRWRLSKLNKGPRLGALPLGTLLANLLAAAVLGLVDGAAEAMDPGSLRRHVLDALGVGLCGSLSTVSTLIQEVNEHMQPLLHAPAAGTLAPQEPAQMPADTGRERAQSSEVVRQDVDVRCNYAGWLYAPLTLGLGAALGLLCTWAAQKRNYYH